jgi:hypothetical protein
MLVRIKVEALGSGLMLRVFILLCRIQEAELGFGRLRFGTGVWDLGFGYSIARSKGYGLGAKDQDLGTRFGRGRPL